MKIFVPRQTEQGETRVAMIPSVLKRLVKLGVTVAVESNAGAQANFTDSEYRDAGAEITPPGVIPPDADIVLTIHPPSLEQARQLPEGKVLIGSLAPLKNLEVMQALAERNVTAFSAEFIPRISRAQSMDVLSSQANIGGYKAVLRAAEVCPKMFPLMTTAAGTLAPAKVFIIGVGVAGLQAIATAKRLGAVVEAYDVRAVTKEQVQSLGARFVELPVAKQEDKATGGYAKEQSEEERQRQVELMAKHVTGADCVITTAAVFGKAPPMLVPRDMVEGMAPGSVLVDLAADVDAGRGNCELTRPGERYTTERGVIIDGILNLPALVPVHASQAYANNMYAFLKEIVQDGQLKLDFEDDIQKGAVITRDGQIVNEMVTSLETQRRGGGGAESAEKAVERKA